MPEPASPSFRRISPFVAQPLLLIVLACCAGITADRYMVGIASLTAEDWWTAAVVGAATGMSLINFRRFRGSLVALVVTFFCLAACWHDYRWNFIATDEVARYATHEAQPACLRGIVRGVPRFNPANRATPLQAIPPEPQTEMEVWLTAIRDRTLYRPLSGTARLRINGVHRGVNVGDEILLYAQLAKPQSPQNPGQYDYAQAERTVGRHVALYTRSPFCLRILESGSRFTWTALVAQLRAACQRQLERFVGFSQGSIAQAMFLGERSLLHEDATTAFIETGTVHLLVVSGLHVGLVATVVWLLCGWSGASNRWQLGATLCVVLLYATLVGMRPPVQRASILVACTLLAFASSRSLSQLNSLALAAAGLIAWSPAEIFRSGTQLSFLGIAAIWAFLGLQRDFARPDPLHKMMSHYWQWWQHVWHGAWRGLLSLVAASVVVWLFVAPLVLYHFNILTPCGLLLGPLLWPLVTIALATGLLICTAGFVFPPLAWLLGKVCGLSLAMTADAVEWASELPWGHFYLPAPPIWWLAALYAGAFVTTLVPRLQSVGLHHLSAFLVWIAVGLGSSWWLHRPVDELRCSFLSVGHGTCVLLELPSGENVLYDAGGLGPPRTIANIVSAVLWERGIRRLDAVVLSHADVDHYNALPDLLDRFTVRKVIVSPVMFDPWADDTDQTAPNFLRQSLARRGVPLEQVWMNDRIRTADPRLAVEVLHPPRFGVGGRDNANSIVLLVDWEGKRILLPGDLEDAGLTAVMSELPQHVDVLLAPHHGSNQSDPPGFAAWSRPRWVVLSGGAAGPREQLTVDSYRQEGAQVYQTVLAGCVTFRFSPVSLACETFHRVASPP